MRGFTIVSSSTPPRHDLADGNNERFRLHLYAQAFNVLNHTNPVGFSGIQTSPFFGRATSALPGRRIETGLRFKF